MLALSNMIKIIVTLSIIKVILVNANNKTECDYLKVNKHLLDTIDKVFQILNANTTNYQKKLITSMHDAVKIITSRNDKVYKSLKSLSKVKMKKKTKQRSLFNLDKLSKIIKNVKLAPDNITDNKIKKIGNFSENTLLSTHEKSGDAYKILKEFLYTAKGTDLLDADSPIRKFKNRYKQTKTGKNKELRIWRDQAGENHNKSRRLYDGRTVNVRRYPFMVSIHAMGDFICAGSIISKKMVITAATCLQIAYGNENSIMKDNKIISIRVGSDYANKYGEVYGVSMVFFHPNYDPHTLKNNIAIAKFRTPLYFDSDVVRVRRIEYRWLKREVMTRAVQVLMVGWEDELNIQKTITPDDDPMVATLLNFYSIKVCKNMYSENFVSENNFCAGVSNKGSGACERDIGGPAIVDSMLVGVVSFGPPVCGTPDAPTVFTNTGYYIKWIDSIVNEDYRKNQVKLDVQKSITYSPLTTTELYTLMPATITKTSTTTPMIYNTWGTVAYPSTHTIKPALNKLNLSEQLIYNVTSYINPNSDIKLRSQYPEAVQAMKILMNTFLSEGQNIDDILYDDDEETEEESDSIEIIQGKSFDRYKNTQFDGQKEVEKENGGETLKFKTAARDEKSSVYSKYMVNSKNSKLSSDQSSTIDTANFDIKNIPGLTNFDKIVEIAQDVIPNKPIEYPVPTHNIKSYTTPNLYELKQVFEEVEKTTKGIVESYKPKNFYEYQDVQLNKHAQFVTNVDTKSNEHRNKALRSVFKNQVQKFLSQNFMEDKNAPQIVAKDIENKDNFLVIQLKKPKSIKLEEIEIIPPSTIAPETLAPLNQKYLIELKEKQKLKEKIDQEIFSLLSKINVTT